jgi:heat shock protein HtpX
MKTLWLKTRLWLCVVFLFAIIYGLISLIAYLFGASMPIFYAILAFVIVAVQFLIGPKIVESSMKIRYVKPHEEPWLHQIVDELSREAGIPKPRVGIAPLDIPNAFAFGKSKRDGRVCVTKGILNTLNKAELKAVLAHEISHIKHKDMVLMGALSGMPLLCFIVYRTFFWSSLFGGRRSGGGGFLIAGIAFVLYFITNLAVLYASRIREYYADAGSAELTQKPENLASGLYRLVVGSLKAKPKELKQVEGIRAFLASDPSHARKDLSDLLKADLNRDGHLDLNEVEAFAKEAKLSKFDRIIETFSTHPNIINRIKRLSTYTR